MNIRWKADTSLSPSRRSPWPLAMLLIVVLIAIGVMGYRYYLEQKAVAEHTAAEQIRAIGNLKAQEIARWLSERRADAAAVFESPIGAVLQTLVADPAALELRRDTQRWLSSLLSYYGYASVALLDAAGQIILSAPNDAPAIEGRVLSYVEHALHTRRVVFSDLYYDGAPRLDFVVPLLTAHNEPVSPVGALLLRIDPNKFLFPLIQSWPTPSPSAETLMAREDGENVLFLNELRHRKDTALSLRLPLNELDLPVAVGIGKEDGEVSGTDYRGVRVLAAIRHIPDSPWYLVAKVDREEINAPLRKNASRTLLIVVLTMLVASLMAWLVWRRQTETLLLGAANVLEARVRKRTVELETANLALQEEIGERKQAEKEVERLNRNLRWRLDEMQALLNVAPIGIAVAQDPEGRVITMNPAGAAMLGVRCDQNSSKSGPLSQQLPFKVFRDGRELVPDELPIQYAAAHDVQIRDLELRVVRQDGRELSLLEYACPLHDEHGAVRGCLGLFVDITARKEAEETFRKQRELLQTIFDHIPVMIALFTQDSRLQLVNREWQRILGWSLEEARCVDLLAELYPDSNYRRYVKSFIRKASGGWSDFRTRVRDGKVLETSWANVQLSDGTTIAIGQDITERKSYESQLEYQANFDALTELPNRTLLQDRLKHAIAHAQRAGHLVGVLFLDLDRFKMINDSLGHAGGDVLLQQVALRLKESVREVDTVARLGGDEFVIVLEDLAENDLVARVAGKVLDAMKLPFSLQGQQFFVNCSVGISLFPKDGEDGPALLKNADTAMHRAKERGRNGVQFYADEMNSRAVQRLALENSLRQALDNGELTLHYQPQVDLDSGNVIGVEALLRWQHPTLKIVSPAEFVPLAEETGLINPIGEWVLKTACAQVKAWKDEGLPALRVGVNLSARQFMQVGLPDLVARVLKETGLEAQYLELEITESLLMQDVEGAVATLKAFKAMGVHLAIDDFGTGYSSLNYLKRFPLDRLKIDKSFVRDITTDPDDAAIALAVIAMAHSLKLRVIAEGVETEAQLAFLRYKHCDEMQGYYFSRPLPALEMTALLRTNAALRLNAGKDDAGRRTLLLVDDEPNITTFIGRILAREGYRILIANSAREGLELLTRHRVGVVVSDHLMPGMNGTEFLQRVRKLYPDTVRIVLSGHSDSDALIEAINEGAIYKFLAKPVDKELLRGTLREAFLASEQWNRRAVENMPAAIAS